MTTPNIEEIERYAEAAQRTDRLMGYVHRPVFDTETVLALIAEVKRLREDAERWRTEMALRNDPTVAIMFVGTQNRCCIYRSGILIAPGSTYVEAIDTARKLEDLNANE